MEKLQGNLEKKIIKEFSKNVRQPKFIYHRYSLERWEICFADDYTEKWFHKNFFEITDYEGNYAKPLKMQKSRIAVMRIIKFMNMSEKLYRSFESIFNFHKENQGLDMSLWKLLKKEEYEEDKITLTIEVDLLSYKKLKENNFIININGEKIKLSLEENWKNDVT